MQAPNLFGTSDETLRSVRKTLSRCMAHKLTFAILMRISAADGRQDQRNTQRRTERTSPSPLRHSIQRRLRTVETRVQFQASPRETVVPRVITGFFRPLSLCQRLFLLGMRQVRPACIILTSEFTWSFYTCPARIVGQFSYLMDLQLTPWSRILL